MAVNTDLVAANCLSGVGKAFASPKKKPYAYPKPGTVAGVDESYCQCQHQENYSMSD